MTTPTREEVQAKSCMRLNAETDPEYRPYCLRCDALVRMQIVERYSWRCPRCGAEHDERRPEEDAEAERRQQAELALEAQRQAIQHDLNVHVAEKVMGLQVHTFDGECFILPDDERLPLYSSDMADAWQVVEKMNALGYSFRLETVPVWSSILPGARAVFRKGVHPPQPGSGENFAVQGTDAPESICRAALAALLACPARETSG